MQKRIGLWIGALVGLTLLYSSFYLINHSQFNSPDETAQAYFIERIATGKPLQASVDAYGSAYVTPRSIRVVNNLLVPASSLGLIALYGAVGSIFGMHGVYIALGVVAASGIAALFQFTRFVWNERIAAITAVLAAFFPGWWYYASLGFFPNVAMLSFALWGIVFYFRFKQSPLILFAMLSGIFTGFALLIRLPALLWIGLTWMLLLIFDLVKKRYFMWKFYAVLFSMIVLVFVIPQLLLQSILYGSPHESGYVISTEAGANFLAQVIPWGIHPRLALQITWDYVVMLFAYVLVPALLAGVYTIFKFGALKKVQRKYITFTVVLAGVLTLYYGSWQLTDNITREHTIGVAYVRYFLPIYLLMLPLLAYSIDRIIKQLKGLYIKKAVLIFFTITYLLISYKIVYLVHNDSLLSIQQTLLENEQVSSEVFTITEASAIIVSTRHDKLFFPHRQVIHGMISEIPGEILKELAEKHNLYWYTTDGDEVIAVEREKIKNTFEVRDQNTLSKGRLYEIIVK